MESTNPSQPIIVHHLNNSRSHRIIWLLEELKVNYKIKFYQRGPDHLAPNELLQVHPLGKSPDITDENLTIAESGAIIEYLVDKYGPQLKPSIEDTQARMQYTFWLHYAEGSLMTPLILKLVFDMTALESPCLIRPISKTIAGKVSSAFIDPNLKTHFTFIENHLEKYTNFAGKAFSAADVQMIFPIQAGVSKCSRYVGEKTKEWLRRMEARKEYKMTVEKAGKTGFWVKS